MEPSTKKVQITIYTDGACSGNPGPGGWGAVLFAGELKKEISGFAKHTTNNRMELTAAIEALRLLKRPSEVKLYSDSSYLVSAFNLNWLKKWQQKGWLNGAGGNIANPDLWATLVSLTQTHNVTWIKVKGHSDNVWNNRCDELATSEIKKARGEII